MSSFGIWLPKEVVDLLNPLEHETVIAELEALATLLSLHLFESYLIGKDVVVFTDNNAVLSALISGRSSNDVVRQGPSCGKTDWVSSFGTNMFQAHPILLMDPREVFLLVTWAKEFWRRV